ncbi:MAG: hypothetical protein GVY05_02585, partial [Bacteroidetes bacterium]|nr:hypothetical protein [Bacteroidota bacterium]
LIFIIFILSSFTFTAQNKIDIKGKVKAKIINKQTGSLLLATSKATYGISSNNQTIAWKKNKLRKIDLSSYTEFYNSDRIIFKKKTLINSNLISRLFNTKGSSYQIINVENGDIEFDSHEFGYKSVLNLETYPKDHSVLFIGIKKKNIFLCHYNLKDKSNFWEVKLGKSNILNAAKSYFTGSSVFFKNESGDIISLFDSNLKKIKTENGVVLNEINGVKTIEYQYKNDNLFLVSKSISIKNVNQANSVFAYKSYDMTPLWNDSIPVFGNVTKTLIYDNKFIAVTPAGFDVIDTKKAKKLWTKTDKYPLIETVIPSHDNNYYVIQDQFLTKVDSSGQKDWNKPVKIFKSDDFGAYFIEQDRDHILSITPSFIHKINSKTGENLWDKPITLNNSSYAERSVNLSTNTYKVWYDQKNQSFMVFSNGDLYFEKIRDSLKPKLIKKFKSQNIPNLEIRDTGYFFKQQNNFAFFDKCGQKAYDTTLTKFVKTKFINETKKYGKKGFDVYKSTLGIIPKQINNIFKNVLVSTDMGFLSNTTSTVYGNYHNYNSLYQEATKIPAVDISSYLEDTFKTKGSGRLSDDEFIFATPKDEGIQFKSLKKETGDITNLKFVKLESKDLIIDQSLNVIYVFGKRKIWIIDINEDK